MRTCNADEMNSGMVAVRMQGPNSHYLPAKRPKRSGASLRFARTLLFGFCTLLTACSSKQTLEPIDPLIPPHVLSGQAAYDRVKSFVDLGPKVAGSPEAEAAAKWIYTTMVSVGIETEIISFKDATPSGTSTFHNVRGVLPGDKSKTILIGCHFDTKAKIDDTFVGANDSGSGVGLLIELAKVLKENNQPGPEFHFAFFDGEECLVHYGANDGFHGSKHMADQYEQAGTLDQFAAVIILDMVGHEDLTITIPSNSDPYLVSKVFEASHNTGHRTHFRLFGRIIADDHTAFMNKGVPAVDLIDFAYGSAPSLNDYWHTKDDTMDKISADSLEIVGKVTLELINLLNVQPRKE